MGKQYLYHECNNIYDLNKYNVLGDIMLYALTLRTFSTNFV